MKKRNVLQWVLILGAAFGVNLAIAAEMDLPAIQHAGDVTYLTGGIGSDQARAIKDVMHNYPMVLTFVGKTSNQNQYLSDVPVTITDGKGNTVLETSSDGPFMLVSLPSGHYTVSVSYKGQAEHRTMNISNAAHARQTFVWAM